MSDKAFLMLQTYSFLITREDHEEALQKAIDSTFSFQSDEWRADLYATLVEGWEGYRVGVERLVWVQESIKGTRMRGVFGGYRKPKKKEVKK